MLKTEGVEVIITGGKGHPMAKALQRTGLQVISGASGEVERVAADFLSGQLVTGGGQCNCSGHH